MCVLCGPIVCLDVPSRCLFCVVVRRKFGIIFIFGTFLQLIITRIKAAVLNQSNCVVHSSSIYVTNHHYTIIVEFVIIFLLIQINKLLIICTIRLKIKLIFLLYS